VSRAIKPHLDILASVGFTVASITRGRHFKVRTMEGPMFTVPVSSSDRRALDNFRSDVRHAWARLKEARPP
jgi:hypothetical protein